MAKIKDIRSRTPRSNGTRTLKTIRFIARHHSATPTGNFDSFWKSWHGDRGWGTGGYAEIILRDGTVELCYDPEEITNGIAGHNSYTYHICVVGNGDFTAEQERVFDERAKYWMKRLNISVNNVLGHNEFKGTSTACPGISMDMVRARLSGKGVVAAVSPSNKWDVKFGDVNDRVGEAQAVLQDLGYYDGKIDDSFGPAMLSAVKTFQRAQGIAVDGIFGPGSQEAARKALSKKYTLGKKLGQVRLKEKMSYRRVPTVDGPLIRELPKGHVCDYYELRNGWVRLGVGWVSNVDGAYVEFLPKEKPKPAPKPVEKDPMYRVIKDGKRIGAFREGDNILNAARKSLKEGAKNVKIELVEEDK